MIEEQGIADIAVVMDDSRQILRKVKDGKDFHKKEKPKAKGKGKGRNKISTVVHNKNRVESASDEEDVVDDGGAHLSGKGKGRGRIPTVVHNNRGQTLSDEEDEVDDGGAYSSNPGGRQSKSKSKPTKKIAPLPNRARLSVADPRPKKRRRRDNSDSEDDKASTVADSSRPVLHSHPRPAKDHLHADQRTYTSSRQFQSSIPPAPAPAPPRPAPPPTHPIPPPARPSTHFVRQQSEAPQNSHSHQRGFTDSSRLMAPPRHTYMGEPSTSRVPSSTQLTPIFEDPSHHQYYPSTTQRSDYLSRHPMANQYNHTAPQVQPSYPMASTSHLSEPIYHQTSNHHPSSFDVDAPYQSRFPRGRQVIGERYGEFGNAMYGAGSNGYDEDYLE